MPAEIASYREQPSPDDREPHTFLTDRYESEDFPGWSIAWGMKAGIVTNVVFHEGREVNREAFDATNITGTAEPPSPELMRGNAIMRLGTVIHGVKREQSRAAALKRAADFAEGRI